jgi:hypothetical protein
MHALVFDNLWLAGEAMPVFEAVADSDHRPHILAAAGEYARSR